MPIVVIAKPVDEFESWVQTTATEQQKVRDEEQKLLAMNMDMDELMTLGEEVYNSRCAACHQVNGLGLPGVFPGLAGSEIATKPERMVDHLNIVIHGKQGTAMQAFGAQLGLKELAAVITYERNAWGNNTGDAIQASQINAVLNGDDL